MNQRFAIKRFVVLAVIATLLLAGAIALISSQARSAQAATPPDSCFQFDSATGTITGYYQFENDDWNSGAACTTAVDIPSQIGGVTVTSIGSYAFAAKQLTSAVIPSSVTSIGPVAFAYNKLTSFTVQGNPSTVSSDILSDNPIEAIIYNGVTHNSTNPVTAACYEFDAGSQTVTRFRRADLTLIKSDGQACLNTNVVIPGTISGVNVTSIGNSAFYNKQLTSVVIPDSVTSIDVGAFSQNQLASVTLPNSVTSINQSAFSWNKLTSITIPNSVTTIGNSAFSSNQLTSVTLPSSVVSIGQYAFENNQLTSVVIPGAVDSIGYGAFYSNRITNVTVEGNPSSIEPDVLRGNPIAVITYNGTTYSSADPVGEACYEFDAGTQSITRFHRADLRLVKSDGQACLNTNIVIPGTIGGVSVARIGYGAFASSYLTSVVIPDTVATIEERAFFDNYLTSVAIPASVTYLGTQAFSHNSLTQVVIHGNLQQRNSWEDPSGWNDPFTFNGLDRRSLPDGFKPLVGNDGSVEDQRVVFDYYAKHADAVAIFATDPVFADRMKPAQMQVACAVLEPAFAARAVNPWTGEESDDCFYSSAYIINPTPLLVTYRDTKTNNLLAAKRFTGKLPNGTYITDYKIHTIAELPYSAETGVDVYFRAGQTITMTPPAIDGWEAPGPFTITTVQAEKLEDNYIPFVYRNGSTDGVTPTPGAPDSGVGARLDMVFAVPMLAAIVILLVLIITSLRPRQN